RGARARVRARQKRATAAGWSRGKAEPRRREVLAHDRTRTERTAIIWGNSCPFQAAGRGAGLVLLSLTGAGSKEVLAIPGSQFDPGFSFVRRDFSESTWAERSALGRKAQLFEGMKVFGEFLPQKLFKNSPETRQKLGE